MQTARGYDRRHVAAWCLYDFANSSYSAVISAVIFPVYYTSYIVGNGAGLGDLWWGRAISLSMLAVALSSPLLGGIADFAGLRKRFLIAFTALSVLSVALLGVLEPGMALAGFVLIVLANYGMEGGLVFYNAFLTEIARPEYQGRVSSWGFGVGYAGSFVSLLVALPLVKAGWYAGAWASVALMFGLFALPAFIVLPADRPGQSIMHSFSRGVRFVWDSVGVLARNREALKFLLAYLLYADGVATVIVFSSVFAATTLGFETPELILLYMVVQITALIGAFGLARAVDTKGPKAVVMCSLVLWATVCVLAYFVAEKAHFWAVAVMAGLALGTVQAASRALYARFVPRGHETEYFGLYALVGKSSAVMGPLVFGAISSGMGSQRPAILAVGGFFAGGLVLLGFVREGRALV